jgi:hypothetical protein
MSSRKRRTLALAWIQLFADTATHDVVTSSVETLPCSFLPAQLTGATGAHAGLRRQKKTPERQIRPGAGSQTKQLYTTE